MELDAEEVGMLLEELEARGRSSDNRPHKLKPGQPEEMARLFLDGVSKAKIGAMFGVTVQTVGYHLNKLAGR